MTQPHSGDKTTIGRPYKAFLLSHKFALVLMLLLGILHTGILLTSQSHVDGDEGVIGIMGQHILLRHEHPLFFYGQLYGTGAALEAHLAAAIFALFGTSGVALKMVSLLLFWGALILVYVISRRFLTERAALWAMALFGLATPLIEWRTKMRGGYAGIPFFSLLVVFFYLQIVERDQKPWHRYFLLGLAMGGAWFNSSLALSLLAALFLHALFVARRFFRPAVLMILVGILLALSPIIWHEIQTDYEYTRYLTSLGTSRPSGEDVQKVFTEFLPRFFIPANVDQYAADLPWTGWLEYSLYAGVTLAAVCLFFTMRPAFPQRRLLGLMILTICIHLLLFSVSTDRARSPRYLLPLYVPLLFMVVIVQHYLQERFSKIRLHYAATAVLGILLGIGIYHNACYLRPSTVTDDILLTDWRIVNVQTDGNLAARIIEYLRARDITYLRTGYFLQWRILFESQETIIASSEGYFPTIQRFAEYDQQVAEANRVAIVLHQDSRQLLEAEESGQVKDMQRVEMDNYVIFTP